jgi:hypothetical protein
MLSVLAPRDLIYGNAAGSFMRMQVGAERVSKIAIIGGFYLYGNRRLVAAPMFNDRRRWSWNGWLQALIWKYCSQAHA